MVLVVLSNYWNGICITNSIILKEGGGGSKNIAQSRGVCGFGGFQFEDEPSSFQPPVLPALRNYRKKGYLSGFKETIEVNFQAPSGSLPPLHRSKQDELEVGTQNATNIVSASNDGRLCVWSLPMMATPQANVRL